MDPVFGGNRSFEVVVFDKEKEFRFSDTGIERGKGEEGDESFHNGKLFDDRCALFRCGDSAGEFHNPNVAEVDFGTFGLKAEVTFFLGGTADAIDELAIYGKFDDSIDADDIVDIPLAAWLAAVLDGATAVPAWVIGGGV